MELPPVVLIDDADQPGVMLSPLTDLRPSYAVRTGALTLLERLPLCLGVAVAGACVPEPLSAIARELSPNLHVNQPERFRGSVLAVSARLGPVDHAAMVALATSGGHGRLVDHTGETIAAVIPATELAEPGALARANHSIVGRADSRRLQSRAWHVRSLRDECLLQDLRLLAGALAADASAGAPIAAPGVTIIPHPHHRLTVGAKARLLPGCIIDLESGPVFIDRGAVVRPGAIIIGPAYVGPGSTVLERATIRQNTAIGPMCKVNGEIGGTIFQGFANKAHDGYLGDSYVGEWVNLGAGTTNSNLLNTYDQVIARPLASPGDSTMLGASAPSNERTGEQFLGCTLGDHVKTAICSRIMTGSIVGTGSMFAASGSLSGTIPAFSWMTDAGTRPYRFDKFMEVARAAMARRSLSPSDAYVARLKLLASMSR